MIVIPQGKFLNLSEIQKPSAPKKKQILTHYSTTPELEAKRHLLYVLVHFCQTHHAEEDFYHISLIFKFLFVCKRVVREIWRYRTTEPWVINLIHSMTVQEPKCSQTETFPSEIKVNTISPFQSQKHCILFFICIFFCDKKYRMKVARPDVS